MTFDTDRMTLNHLSFPSTDPAATAGFFERQLGCTVTPMGTSRLVKRPGFDIVIEDAAGRPVAWPHNFHVGLECETLADVEAAHAAFAAAGVAMKTGVFRHARGSRFFCEAPGGLLFEINTRSDAEPAFRATFDSQRRTSTEAA